MELQDIKNRIPTTAGRVPDHTAEWVNEKIESEMKQRLNEVGSDPLKIDARLRELDQEWDIERVLEANASMVSLAGLSLGATVSRKWLLLPVAVAGFLLLHAVQGWCPPLPILRRLGFRTAREIENERTILKSRRGDLKNLDISFADAAAIAVH